MSLFRALLQAITTANFWPLGHPDYTVAGQGKNAVIDAAGNVAIRGPVLTDEESEREDFITGSTPTGYNEYANAGGGGGGSGSISYANSLATLTLPNGATSGARAVISHPIDYLPMVFNLYTNAWTRVANSEFFFGLYDNPDPALAVAYVEALFPSTITNTQMNTRAQSAAGAGNNETTTATACSSSATAVWRSMILTADGCIWRDGSTATEALPTTTTRLQRSRHVPDIYTPLYFAFGLRATGTLGGANTVNIDTVTLRNFDLLDVNTAR